MKKLSISFLCFLLSLSAMAQVPFLNAIPNSPSKKSMVSERVGLTQISISYNRPAVNGREGKVWGQLVHKGFIKQGFGTDNPAPWRAGANENTVIEFSRDVKIEGQTLPAGRYGFFVAFDPNESTLIFSRKSDAWGSYFYDEKEDALRVKVKPQPLAQSVEWLKYEFLNQTENSAVIALQWEKLSIPFSVETNYLKDQFEAIVSELKGPSGFTWQALNTAAQWCLSRNYELNTALGWINLATDPVNGFGAHDEFGALSTKAQILEKMGRGEEAQAVMKAAMPLGSMLELHQYGRQLLGLKKAKEALEVFQLNHSKNPKDFTTLVGMMRGLSANGDFKKALDFGNKAVPLAPNEANKNAVLGMIDKLKAGKDVN